jgi:hypothetical protein
MFRAIPSFREGGRVFKRKRYKQHLLLQIDKKVANACSIQSGLANIIL